VLIQVIQFILTFIIEPLCGEDLQYSIWEAERLNHRLLGGEPGKLPINKSVTFVCQDGYIGDAVNYTCTWYVLHVILYG